MNKTTLHIFLTFFMLLTTAGGYAQKKVILGKVISKTRDLERIYVRNISTNESVFTDKGGYFHIEAGASDTLMFSAIHMIGREKILTPADMKKSMVFIPMEYAETVLDELVIYRKVTTESLGLGGARKYTPAERRLHTATSSAGGIIAIDAIVNAISGRTKMLEKALELEREYMLVQQILERFPEDFYTKRLNIPIQYYMAFGYFMAQDPIVLTSYRTVSSSQLSMMYTEKAVEFLEIVSVLK